MNDPVRPTGVRRALERGLDWGPTAQSIVAGVYAWAVTVAPVGYGRHGGTQNWPATIFATLAFVALLRGAIVELVTKKDAKDAATRIAQSRTLTLFSFSAMSLVTWILDDGELSPVHLGIARGMAGMLGWALFAYACSAPVVEPVTTAPNGHAVRVEAGGRARGRVERGDALFVLGGAVLALALQLVGWNVTSTTRAIFVRVTTLGAAVMLLGGIGAYVSTRHGEEPREKNLRARVRIKGQRPLPLGWVIALLLLLAAGILYVLTD
jgi:hypothetical protein